MSSGDANDSDSDESFDEVMSREQRLRLARKARGKIGEYETDKSIPLIPSRVLMWT